MVNLHRSKHLGTAKSGHNNFSRENTVRPPWWSRLLCWLGCHDWRDMNGRCAVCPHVDPLWPPVQRRSSDRVPPRTRRG